MNAIEHKYGELINTNPWIGKPSCPVSNCPDGVGQYQHYESGASIYWTPNTGAHLIYGLIRQKWANLGWERGPNGYPITDEADAGSGKGRFNGFQNGTIIWKRGTNEAFTVYGAIVAKWGEQNWDKGFLGFPVTDELGTPDGIGRFNHFEGGSIYWTPNTGAHLIYGLIRQKWANLGWERGPNGYPISDEEDAENGQGRSNNFQNGLIIWKAGTREAFAIHGEFYEAWAKLRKSKAPLGFPITDEISTNGKRIQKFINGSISWTQEDGLRISNMEG
jgi:uncharacterized protein with LGFP repeats